MDVAIALGLLGLVTFGVWSLAKRAFAKSK